MLGYNCPTCADGCEDLTLPAFRSEFCAKATKIELSEIKRILLALEDPEKPGEPIGGPTDWTSAASWDTAIDNTAANKVREIWGVGDLGDSQDTTITVHDNQTVVTNRRRTLNFTQMDLNAVNHTAMRALQCGGAGRLWFETRGGFMRGGQNGIGVNILPPTEVIGRGAEAYVQINWVFEWDAICSPERVVSPFAGGAPVGP